MAKLPFEMPLIQQKWIAFRGTSIGLVKGLDGLWRDDTGTIYAYAEGKQADASNNCGVGIFTLPDGHPLNDICKAHDFQYSSPAYQAFNTRKEADEYLRRTIQSSPQSGEWWLLAKPFYWLTRLFGGKYWENDKTR